MTGIRVWIPRMNSFSSPVMIVQVCSHSSFAGSFQPSHKPANTNGAPQSIQAAPLGFRIEPDRGSATPQHFDLKLRCMFRKSMTVVFEQSSPHLWAFIAKSSTDTYALPATIQQPGCTVRARCGSDMVTGTQLRGDVASQRLW